MSTFGTLGLIASYFLLVFSFGLSFLTHGIDKLDDRGQRVYGGEAASKKFLWARICFYAGVTLVFWCTMLLALAFILNDFSLLYVVNHSSLGTPWYYRLSAMWAGREGSSLIWAFLTLSFAGFASAQIRLVGFNCYRRFILISSLIGAGLLAFVLLAANPFSPKLVLVGDGFGLNAQLMDWAMIVHPPLLFCGYALLAVVFVIAVSDPDQKLIAGLVSRWSRFAAAVLTAGIVTGAIWAYDELGWGGYWGWDPVENASLLPWLIVMVLIHYARGNAKRVYKPVVLLAGGAFAATLMAAYLTRSGVVFSLHAFAGDATSSFFLIGLVLVLFYSFARRRAAAELPWRTPIALYAGGVVMLLMALTVLLGTLWPSWGKLFIKNPGPLSAGFYNSVIAVMGLFLLGLLAVSGVNRIVRARRVEAVLFAMTVSSVLAFVFWYLLNLNDPGRLAGVIIIVFNLMVIVVDWLWYRRFKRGRLARNFAHVGLLVLSAGLAGSMGEVTQEPIVLSKGEVAESQSLAIELVDLDIEEHEDNLDFGESAYKRVDVVSHLRVKGVGCDVVVSPAQSLLADGSRRSDVDFSVGFISDIYAVLEDFNGREAMVSVRRNWLVGWVWIGSFLILVACILATRCRWGEQSC